MRYEEQIWGIAHEITVRLNNEGMTLNEKLDSGDQFAYTDIDNQVIGLTCAIEGVNEDTDEFTDAYNNWWGIITSIVVDLMSCKG